MQLACLPDHVAKQTSMRDEACPTVRHFPAGSCSRQSRQVPALMPRIRWLVDPPPPPPPRGTRPWPVLAGRVCLPSDVTVLLPSKALAIARLAGRRHAFVRTDLLRLSPLMCTTRSSTCVQPSSEYHIEYVSAPREFEVAETATPSEAPAEANGVASSSGMDHLQTEGEGAGEPEEDEVSTRGGLGLGASDDHEQSAGLGPAAGLGSTPGLGMTAGLGSAADDEGDGGGSTAGLGSGLGFTPAESVVKQEVRLQTSRPHCAGFASASSTAASLLARRCAC